MKLTSLESVLMAAIPTENFYENGFDSVLWTDCFIDGFGMDAKKVRGILSSLKKKGLIEINNAGEKDDEGRSESTITLKDLGKEWLIENEITDLDGHPVKYASPVKAPVTAEELPLVELTDETTSAPEKDLTADLAAATGPKIRTRRNTITLAASQLNGFAHSTTSPNWDWKKATDDLLTILDVTVDDSQTYKALRRAVRREALTTITDPTVIERLKLK